MKTTKHGEKERHRSLNRSKEHNAENRFYPFVNGIMEAQLPLRWKTLPWTITMNFRTYMSKWMHSLHRWTCSRMTMPSCTKYSQLPWKVQCFIDTLTVMPLILFLKYSFKFIYKIIITEYIHTYIHTYI